LQTCYFWFCVWSAGFALLCDFSICKILRSALCNVPSANEWSFSRTRNGDLHAILLKKKTFNALRLTGHWNAIATISA
jgi:hypothetical protein